MGFLRSSGPCPAGEKREMVELYMKRGMTEADAESVIHVIGKYNEFFLEVMMVEELGLMPPDDTHSAATNGRAHRGATPPMLSCYGINGIL